MPIYALEVTGHPHGQASDQNRLAYAAPAMHDDRSLRAGEKKLLQDAELVLQAHKAVPHRLDFPQHDGLLEELGADGLYLAYIQALWVQQVEHWRGKIDLIASLDVPHGQPGLSQGLIMALPQPGPDKRRRQIR